MKAKGIVGILAAVAIVLLLGTHAEAQLAKKGTYSGRFSWSTHGKTVEMAPGHEVFSGKFAGVFNNDEGKGFLHESSWVCPGVNETKNDVTQSGKGYCLVTDTDGDKAFLSWGGGKATKPGKANGKFEWTGGTGKYAGITGSNTYSGTFILPTSEGYSDLKGDWELP